MRDARPQMSNSTTSARLIDSGLVAIIRADSSEQLLDAARALVDGGISAMEVTMTTPNALQVIADARAAFGDALLLGVGTVLDAQTCHSAVEGGAQFIVTPVTKIETIRAAHEHGVPIASGAFTPSEAYAAHEAGADFIKIFPADLGGPAYIRTMLAPLPMLRIIPTGGVTPENAGAFLGAGCVALGAGSTLVSKDILQNRDWPKLTARAGEFVRAIRECRTALKN
jgi:2-dehydro-3-deoxyphosphogluconate aldolase/(4S)-4-hydroxy-2-oxoglutarate aldolase